MSQPDAPAMSPTGLQAGAGGVAAPGTGPAGRPAVSRMETGAVAVLLAVLLLGRWLLARHLEGLGALAVNDVFFDADPDQYLQAMAHGWGFGRTVHPAFALLFNLPLRALDQLLSMAGWLAPGAVRSALPLWLAPCCTGLAGWLWWRAACLAGFSLPGRLAGLLVSQLAFGASVFGVLPESYAVSGLLLTALLGLVVQATREPDRLDRRGTQVRWLLLACLMTGITLTNGLLCVAVWAAVRLGRVPLRRWCREGVLAIMVVGATGLALVALDRAVYRVPGTAEATAQGAAQWTRRFATTDDWARKVWAMPLEQWSALVPTGLAQRVPTADAVAPLPAFSLSAAPRPALLAGLAWCAWLGLLWAVWRWSSNSVLPRALLAVLLFNGALHTVFGRETFLYAMHWLPFLCFALVAPLSAARGLGQRLALASVTAAVLLASGVHWWAMLHGLQRSGAGALSFAAVLF